MSLRPPPLFIEAIGVAVLRSLIRAKTDVTVARSVGPKDKLSSEKTQIFSSWIMKGTQLLTDILDAL